MYELAFDEEQRCNDNLLMNCSHEQIEGMLKFCHSEEREKLQNSIWKRRYSRDEVNEDEPLQLG